MPCLILQKRKMKRTHQVSAVPWGHTPYTVELSEAEQLQFLVPVYFTHSRVLHTSLEQEP